MERVGEALSTMRQSLANSCKPYSELTLDERRERERRTCDHINGFAGNLNEVDGIDCPTCKNRGYVAVVSEHEFAGETVIGMATQECACMVRRASVSRMRRSGLSDTLDGYTFAAYEATEPWQEHVKNQAIAFTDTDGGFFFIGGQSGCGKTHICTAIVGELLRRGKAAHYMLWQDETVKLKASVTDSEQYGATMHKLKTVPVLYIDDFLKPIFRDGAAARPTDADLRLAYEIINHRYNGRRLHTVISSERLLGEIIELDEAVGGRIAECARGYTLNIACKPGRNYRLRFAGTM